ncbi:hypothetical protein ACFWFU_36070 [Streptomyces sp. NPDC060235]|uniref:hypothetical protein n=1 Tax=Streptomyces sp. NPDC060235 TaxID=3347080 RepID=UPI0036678505
MAGLTVTVCLPPEPWTTSTGPSRRPTRTATTLFTAACGITPHPRWQQRVCAGGPRVPCSTSRGLKPLQNAWQPRPGILWQQLFAVHPPALPLSVFEDRWEEDPHEFLGGPRTDGMLAAHRTQPLVEAYIHHPSSLGLDYPGTPICAEHPIIGFRCSRAAYIRKLSWIPQDTDVLTVDIC